MLFWITLSSHNHNGTHSFTVTVRQQTAAVYRYIHDKSFLITNMCNYSFTVCYIDTSVQPKLRYHSKE